MSELSCEALLKISSKNYRIKSKKEPISVLSWLVLHCLIFVTVTVWYSFSLIWGGNSTSDMPSEMLLNQFSSVPRARCSTAGKDPTRAQIYAGLGSVHKWRHLNFGGFRPPPSSLPYPLDDVIFYQPPFSQGYFQQNCLLWSNLKSGFSFEYYSKQKSTHLLLA